MTGEVIRENKNSKGELISLVIAKDEGGVETVKANEENIIKYCTSVMEEFGEDNTIEFEDITVRRVTDRKYDIEKHDIAVRNMPSNSEDVLLALREAIESRNTQDLHDLWSEIYERQVNREALNKLVGHVVPEENINISDTGWEITTDTGVVVILTWESEVYHVSQDKNKAYVRSGNSVDALENGAEFLEIKKPVSPTKYEELEEHVSGKRIELSSGETLNFSPEDIAFLTKAKWLIEAGNQYDDEVFWNFVKRYQEGI